MQALMFFIYVSDECHRSCDHCYRQGRSGKMSLETSRAVTRWIANICMMEDIRWVKIVFHGGEPLNNAEIMLDFIDQTNLLLPETIQAHPDGKFLFHTNGDLLNDYLLKEIKKRRLIVMLNPVYDSLKVIEEKINMIKSICGGCSLSIVLNDVNLPRLTEITKLAIKHSTHMRINRLYEGGTIPGYVNEYKNQMKRMFEMLLKAEKPMWPNWIMESTYPTWDKSSNPYSCGKWLLVIDIDGSIRSCNADPNTKMGSIYTHQRVQDFKYFQRWSAKNLPECQGCQWIIWCQGGCPYTRKLTWNTYDRKSPFCEAFKKLFPDLIKIKRKWESKVEI